VATAFQVSAAPGPRSPSRVVGIVVATVGAVAVLAVAGITFLALAVAFPIAVHAVQEWGLPAKPADIAIARQFAGFWWLFAVAGVAAFGAAVATVVEVIRRYFPTTSA
jgi:hypothetical protein